MIKKSLITLFSILFTVLSFFCSKKSQNLKLFPISKGWSKTSINTTIFRKNSVISFKDNQMVAFYDDSSNVILAKRKLDSSNWQIKKTKYKGNCRDAHNSISIAIDGNGYIHMAWNHHNNPLHYCQSKQPLSLELTEKIPMTGQNEENVTYPEFYKLSNGDLIFLYRDGASGNGNLILNYYNVKEKKWAQVQDNLIDGEGQRNAYWQMAVAPNDALHLSWVWRETPDVATNHDICYAKSFDLGKTWQKSNGEIYQSPITAANAEYAWRIPQNSELINQTSMCVDSYGNPYIATYWLPKGADIPQYFIVYLEAQNWKKSQAGNRNVAFRLSGGGTKSIPISRPQVVVKEEDNGKTIFLIFRDDERGSVVSIASSKNLTEHNWQIENLTVENLGRWEPSFDPALWNREQTLHLFHQKVNQGDGEKMTDLLPQMVSVLVWQPK